MPWHHFVVLTIEVLEPLLARTPAAFDALLRGLPEAWTVRNEGETTWTAFDVIGHLIQTERTAWMPRVKCLLDFGTARAFDPVDRFAQLRDQRGRPLTQLLDDFARLREESLGELRALNLQPADLERRGLHPALGEVTLAEVLAAWTGHDLTHLHQISRIMAHQCRHAVGPWSRFLGVLQCSGHSAPA
jgi:DinB superfamily